MLNDDSMDLIESGIQQLFPQSQRPSADTSSSPTQMLENIEATDASGGFFLSLVPIVPTKNPLKRVFFEGVPTVLSEDGPVFPDHRLISSQQRPLSRRLDLVMLEHVFLNLQKHRNLTLKISMSAKSIADGQWQSTFKSLVIANKDESSRLVLSFFEESLFDVAVFAHVFLRDAAGTNVRFGVSDFGSSFCSLRDLKDLPLDVITIDPALFYCPSSAIHGENLLMAISDFCRFLGSESVASGINSENAFALAKRLGWDWLQGSYLTSR
jgi:EAL domain-containing protein (putative c-di-GMP-specific phosphodiesterase class I)